MKTCPICAATTFDDMEVCFSCLHRFDGDSGGNAEKVLTVRRDDVTSATQAGKSSANADKTPPAAGSPSGFSLPYGAVAPNVSEPARLPAYRVEITLVPVE